MRSHSWGEVACSTLCVQRPVFSEGLRMSQPLMDVLLPLLSPHLPLGTPGLAAEAELGRTEVSPLVIRLLATADMVAI